MKMETVWSGKPWQHKWAEVRAGVTSNNLFFRIELSRQLTGERLPEVLGISLPAECVSRLIDFLETLLPDEEGG